MFQDKQRLLQIFMESQQWSRKKETLRNETFAEKSKVVVNVVCFILLYSSLRIIRLRRILRQSVLCICMSVLCNCHSSLHVVQRRKQSIFRLRQ